MKLYFACSLTGGRDDEAIYAVIVEHLLGLGHEVPTAHLAHPEVMELEQRVDPHEVFTRDVTWIQACDALIAEISTPSHGVGYEIAYSLSMGKQVLCVHHRDAPISKMLSGNDTPGLRVAPYADPAQALLAVDHFLSSLAG